MENENYFVENYNVLKEVTHDLNSNLGHLLLN